MRYPSRLVHVLLRRAYQTALDLRSGPPSQLVSCVNAKQTRIWKKRNAKPAAVEPGQVAKGSSHQQQTHAAGMGRMIERPRLSDSAWQLELEAREKRVPCFCVFLGLGVASSSSGGTSSSRSAGWVPRYTCFDGESSQSDYLGTVRSR